MTVFFRPISAYLFLTLVAGIIIGNFGEKNSFWVLFLWPIATLTLISFFLTPLKKYSVAAVLIFVLVSGIYLIQARLSVDLPSNHIVNYTSDEKQHITGRIVSFARHEKGKTKYVVECQEITSGQQQVSVTGKINVSVYRDNGSQFAIGDTISFTAKIRPIRNFGNPGGFDYKRFLQRQGIYGSAWTNGKKIKKTDRGAQKDILLSLLRYMGTLKNDFYYFVCEQTQYSDTGKILISLVTGKKEVLPPNMRDLFSRAGISHLLAISGLHLSIVSVLFFWLLYWLLSFNQSLSISGTSKKLAGLLTIMPLALYSLLTGFSPSTQRALIMVIVMLITYASEKPKDILSSFSIAGILILIWDATAIFSVSFQLSFAAVGFIIAGLSLLKKYAQGLPPFLTTKPVMMIWITIFAGLGTAPLTAFYFNMISGVGILLNLIAIPVVGFVVLPMGLISMITFQVFPFLSSFLVFVCTKLIELIIMLAQYLSLVPGSWSRIVTPHIFELVCIYLIFIAAFIFFRKRYKVAAVLLMSVLVGVVVFYGGRMLQNNATKPLVINVIDVGQGSCALIQTPENQNILVDGGGFSGLSSFDPGRFIVGPFLWKKRIRHLDYLILSHPEGDHLNGLVFILDNFSVGTLIKNDDQAPSKTYDDVMRLCEKKSVKRYTPFGSKKNIGIGSTILTFVDTVQDNPYQSFNENSLVFQLRYNDFAMVFAGDILKKREKKLALMEQVDLSSQILLVPHHGSLTSSSQLFLDKVAPGSVIISCGWKNRYGFPHWKVLQRYNEKGIRVFRTDTHGAVVVTSDGRNYSIATHKGGS